MTTVTKNGIPTLEQILEADAWARMEATDG